MQGIYRRGGAAQMCDCCEKLTKIKRFVEQPFSCENNPLNIH